MRALFLETGTSEVQKYAKSLENLGLGPVTAVRYDISGGSEAIMYGQIKDFSPDLVVYIGQCGGRQSSIATLCKIKTLCPTVHVCSDAADQPWWELLRAYHAAGAFSLQVAIDGSHKWPLSSSQMTALTPVDPALFPQKIKPHSERGTICGFAGGAGGGPGSKRTQVLTAMLEKGVIDLRVRSNLPYTYDAYCKYLSNLRMHVNVAYTGTEEAVHVKGRVLESGIAGALLLETKGSPTSYWFRPGMDYLEYANAAEAVAIVRRLENEPQESQQMAESLRARVLNEHSPAQFWQRIFERIGLKVAA